jgi:hypothetical protein
MLVKMKNQNRTSILSAILGHIECLLILNMAIFMLIFTSTKGVAQNDNYKTFYGRLVS